MSLDTALRKKEIVSEIKSADAIERELATHFLSVNTDTEQRVLRQVVEALLFEGMVEFRQRPRVNDEFFGARSSEFEAIYDLLIDFSVGSKHFYCLATIRAFDRVRVAQRSIKVVEQGKSDLAGELRACRIYELITCLDMQENSKQRLCAELAQTIALCEWNKQHLDLHLRPRRELSFQELESTIHEGHLYHPCFKTRTGFSEEDHRLYGPEAGNSFQLHWFAVARQRMDLALPSSDKEFWRRELGEAQWSELTERLQAKNADWSDYALVPVHPWQRQSVAELGIEEAMLRGEIIDLGIAGDHYRATQSMRTLVNVSDPNKANIKVPINIVCTSSRRNLQQHFVCTAPAISDWLQNLVAKDAFLQAKQNLILLSEYAGMLYEPEKDPVVADEDTPQGLLGAIFRESVVSKLQEGEVAVPYTALMLLESDGRPFVAEWLDVYGVEPWLNRLLEVVLIPIWHMLVHHGVGLEVHAQNLVLVHKQGWPQKIAVRDFHENTEYVPDYLASPEEFPDLENIDPYFSNIAVDDGYRMANVDELRELVMDTLLVFNLADLSFLLERYFGYSEQTFWNLVRTHLLSYEQSGVTDIARINRLDYGSPEIIVESLLKKKISSTGILQLFHHRVKNMLYCEDGEIVAC